MNHSIVGEGAYGCVHKPSIPCKIDPSPNFDYKKYVSKLMKNKNAQKEFNEFVIIKDIDPTNEFHLGQPIMCHPDISSQSVKDDIDKCKYIKSANVQQDENGYNLLLLKYGGPDLKEFCTNKIKTYFSENKDEKFDKFWLEVHNLLRGLLFFKTNNIVHNDIKPQNILFNLETGDFKYIDFGLMRKSQDIKNLSKSNKNMLGIIHWSYPIDCGFMDNDFFSKYKNYSEEKKIAYKEDLCKAIVMNKKSTQFRFPMNNPYGFKTIFAYITLGLIVPSAETQYAYINSFFDGFNEIIKTNSYEKILDTIVDTIDVYGLGFTLQYVLNAFKIENLIDLGNYNKLSNFFIKMHDFNPLNRTIEINHLLNDYENILLEMGILTKLNKRFENHLLVNKSPIPSEIKNVSVSPKKLSNDLIQYSDQDPISIIVNCNSSQEFNPFTKLCVEKCIEGYTRNPVTFKCVKTRTAKTRRATLPKHCAEGKELNPRTNRCVKKCKDGYERDLNTFKCISKRRRTKKLVSK